jgi:hypothetical protein
LAYIYVAYPNNDVSSTKGARLVEIVEEQFPLKREVQQLAEANTQELFDLILVKSEFELHGLRIDTLYRKLI